jgi:hypothetical protein
VESCKGSKDVTRGAGQGQGRPVIRDLCPDAEAQDDGEGGVSGSDGCEAKNTPPSQSKG